MDTTGGDDDGFVTLVDPRSMSRLLYVRARASLCGR